MTPTQGMTLFAAVCPPPPPSKEEGKRFQRRGEDFEIDAPTSCRLDFRMWRQMRPGLSLRGWWALHHDAMSSPFRVLFQGLPSGPCWHRHVLELSYPPPTLAPPSLEIISYSPKRTTGSFFPPHVISQVKAWARSQSSRDIKT